MKSPYVPSIPQDATPWVAARHANGAPMRTEYARAGALVGVQLWNAQGHLELETPLLAGLRHGIEYAWHAPERLASAEPYQHGLAHGVACQWAEDGRLLGTYTMKNGTGIDLWRDLRADGSAYLAEVRHLKAGKLHGPEWWIQEDQASVFIERCWHEGRLHGVEREWDTAGRLDDDYPKCWVQGRQVSRETYQATAAEDSSLPALRQDEEDPKRRFPPNIIAAIGAR